VIGLSPVRDRVVASSELLNSSDRVVASSELFNSSLFFGESDGFIGSSELLNSFKVVAQREREREIERERERTHTQTHTHTHTHTHGHGCMHTQVYTYFASTREINFLCLKINFLFLKIKLYIPILLVHARATSTRSDFMYKKGGSDFFCGQGNKMRKAILAATISRHVPLLPIP